jgi:poly-gamma-glutamate capsule biosynthesis protein CapA/YwtB (metallophosphatase superfamily)
MAVITVFLGGDVMTGRGVDQILPHPSTPQLWERHAMDARDYVALAEQANGPIPRRVPMSWPWGDALPVLDALAPEARIVNLETSVTECSAAAAGKSVHYRMHPANAACLTAARLDACALANNHLLDFGVHGLTDTLDTLAGAGLATSGAGRTREQARRPVRVNGVVLTACAATSSGVPADWAATEQRPGVDLLADLRAATADTIATRARDAASCGDLVIVSIHWGAN